MPGIASRGTCGSRATRGGRELLTPRALRDVAGEHDEIGRRVRQLREQRFDHGRILRAEVHVRELHDAHQRRSAGWSGITTASESRRTCTLSGRSHDRLSPSTATFVTRLPGTSTWTRAAPWQRRVAHVAQSLQRAAHRGAEDAPWAHGLERDHGDETILRAARHLEVELLELQAVQAEEQHLRAHDALLLAVDLHAHRIHAPVFPHAVNGRDHRDELVTSPPLLEILALFEQVPVETEARIVEEQVAVDGGGVHEAHVAVRERRGRLRRIERNAQIAREVVERAHRQHAHDDATGRQAAAGDDGSHAVDGAVAARRHQHARRALRALHHLLREPLHVLRRARQQQLELAARTPELRLDALAHGILVVVPRAGVEDDRDRQRAGSRQGRGRGGGWHSAARNANGTLARRRQLLGVHVHLQLREVRAGAVEGSRYRHHSAGMVTEPHRDVLQ